MPRPPTTRCAACECYIAEAARLRGALARAREEVFTLRIRAAYLLTRVESLKGDLDAWHEQPTTLEPGNERPATA